MNTPTAADIRSWANPATAWAEWGYPVTDPNDDPLERFVSVAGQHILNLTGWQTYTGVDPAMDPLVAQAITLAVQKMAAQSTPEYLETVSDFDLIQSFSAGSYSETRRGIEEAASAKVLDDWPSLHAAILAAMSPDALAAWLAYLQGDVVPAFSVTEVDWSGGYGPCDLWGWQDPAYAWSEYW